MTTEEMQKQIESMMPTPKQIVEHIDKNLRNNMAKIMKAEQYISDCTRNCSNELCSVEDRYGKTIISYHEWLTPDQALRAAEIAKEETIDKACEWLESNVEKYIYNATPPYPDADFKACVGGKCWEYFRKAMED